MKNEIIMSTDTKTMKGFFALSFLLFISAGIVGQSLSVGDGATLFFKQGTAFTTSGNVVTPHSNGEFLVEAGFDWTTAGEAEYVDGPITVFGAGITTLHVGDEGVYSPMIVETASLDDEFVGTYLNTAPTSAAVASAFGNHHYLSDVEHWTISKIAGASSGVQLSVV